MESVEDVIRKALPALQERDYHNLLTHLAGIGVKTECDLKFVTFEDLKDTVPLIAGRRLIHFLKNRGRENLTSDQLGNCTAGSSSSSTSPTAPIHSRDWMSSYEVPWEKMTPNLRQCVAQGQQPRKQDHLAMVRIIVDSIRELCLNPSRNQCSEIARRITDKYPKSFADLTMEGELIGCGYGSLLNQIKTRVEHVNRDNTLVRVRRVKRPVNDSEPVSSNEAPASKCSKTDSYGCISWHPLNLPADETPESVEEKRKAMVNSFSEEGPRAAEHGQVEEFMKITYATQRYAINSNPPPSIDEMKDQWPFLFLKKFMCGHFYTLTGIEIGGRLLDTLCRKGKKVIHFFESQLQRWKKEVRKVLKDIDDGEEDINHGVASVLTLMAFFKENEDALFLLADVTATSADVEGSLPIPSTPRLIARGDSVFTATSWMLTMEGQVLIQPQELTDFPSALAVLFCCYYIFNVQYQEEAASTLEFIQRFILRLNPDGSKCQATSMISRTSGKRVNRKLSSLNPRVMSLIKELVDFEWQNY
ncbi:uncharacterized protein LOC117832466 [Notolabrus celidotus]|uniref:uncharacterized protein LOC117832466 n=1 Tax=Notolabrus celidotus TaxID=1203425 RepID=UPI0014905ED9|nr:uncharacterized protein LOC117832466 [Notolabrus celidotus]